MKELTKAEDQIMQILWKIKKGFVKDVIAEMPEPKPAYNTVSTIIRILETKGFVDHYTYGKTYEYYPLIERDAYRSFYLKNLLRNYFGGKFEHLVSFFARDNDLNVDDMEEILKHVETDLDDSGK
jgi:BlaI family transcriptional regulator, penicillinase repressor